MRYARFGGEEFVVLLRERSQDEAYLTAERIRAILISIPYSGTLTVSIGVSLYPEHGGNREDVFQAADMALYRAKGKGEPDGRGRIIGVKQTLYQQGGMSLWDSLLLLNSNIFADERNRGICPLVQ